MHKRTEYYRMNKVVKVDEPAAVVCAQLSCGDPQENLSNCILSGDLTTFSCILADIAPLDDHHQLSLSDDEKKVYPLPEEHWINQPLISDNPNLAQQLLLQVSVQQGAVEFTQLLVRAGARANMYNDETNQAVIHTAVLSQHGEDHLTALLSDEKNKADINCTLQPSSLTPLHLAAERGKLTCLNLLLEHPDIQIDPRDGSGGRTPLFLAARGKHVECVRKLVEQGASLDIKCGRTTPRTVIQENLPYLDLSKIKVKERPVANTVETLFQYIERKDFLRFRYTLTKVSLRDVSEKSVRGYTCLQKAVLANLPTFVTQLLNHGVNPNLYSVENPVRPVLLASYRGHYQVLSVFVEELETALSLGKVSKVSPNFAVWSRDTQETCLHMILKKSHSKALLGLGSDSELKGLDEDYRKCLNILLSSEQVRSQLGRVINKRDILSYTPLHYAAQMWSQADITKLLKLGANIGVRNSRGEIPLSRILPETLEEFLNHCSNHENHPLHQDFKVEFNYSWLAPPVDDYQSEEWDQHRQDELERAGLPETESLWCMSQSKSHRHLLRHPTVTSFLWLKWQRVRRFFSRNIRIYLLFVTCLTWYIFTRFGGIKLNSSEPSLDTGALDPPAVSSSNSTQFCKHPRFDSGAQLGFWMVLFVIESIFLLIYAIRDLFRECGCKSGTDFMIAFLSSWFEMFLAALIILIFITGEGGLWWVITLLFVTLTLREIFQMTASLKRYFFSLENLLEIAMLGLLGVLLFAPDTLDPTEDGDCVVLRHIAAVCILLSWTEMIILVAKHPRLSRYNVYISMFYKVLQTFFLFLVWYSFFIIAFALGFYIMLHKDIPNFTPDSDHYVYFDSPWTSLVKTSTMFVGELEFSDIPIDTESNLAWLSFTFLLVFVFFIVVILMNLLNGLAVSDTGIIMEKAEIVSYTARVETISYMESVLLGDPFLFLSHWPRVSCLARLPSLALCNQVYSACPGARKVGHCLTGATGILLFYSLLPEKKASFPMEDKEGCGGCRVVQDIPQDILQAARDLALKKETEKEEEADQKINSKILKMLEIQQEQIQSLQAQLQTVINKTC
ncbi:transient receptor potential cation channel protein painless [Eurytemora carolleeae]|uniref:transient receptor potential cation channel protein painless n=1 Tax=Eurytemora carolleeae TaxID=1294199 RepID=UPI000C75BB45|nr:transient receptor potential cation channel protein painless [Eurytemora carolleeae]|eukprot:XP_023344392.1 transient receptor potential cation channel protein painless-like [Eurytemora affinis]